MRHKYRKKPAYTIHKPSGQTRVLFGGKSDYLGDYGSQVSEKKHEDLIAEWLAVNDDEGGGDSLNG